MQFQYFFPNVSRVTLEQLLEAGLGYVFEPETAAKVKTPFTPRPITNGPGGQHGIIVSLSDEHCGYYKEQQVWEQEIDTEYWVGMWTAEDKRPTPETLARENMITGQWLRLVDGHDWLLPMARHWVEFEAEVIYHRTLPARLTRNSAGEWRPGDVKPRFRELWRLATEFMQSYLDNDSVEFTELDNLVIECFRTNYRVSAIEINLLGIHEDHLRTRVPQILLDIQAFETLLKKKLTTLATGNSSAGQPGLPPGGVTETITPQQVT